MELDHVQTCALGVRDFVEGLNPRDKRILDNQITVSKNLLDIGTQDSSEKVLYAMCDAVSTYCDTMLYSSVKKILDALDKCLFVVLNKLRFTVNDLDPGIIYITKHLDESIEIFINSRDPVGFDIPQLVGCLDGTGLAVKSEFTELGIKLTFTVVK